MLPSSMVLETKLTCSTSTWSDTDTESNSMADCQQYRLPGSKRGQLLRPGSTTQALTWDSRIIKATGSGVRDGGR